MLSEYTDDALAEAFAADADGECLYVSSRGGWFVSKFDDAADKEVWVRDDTLRIWASIRYFLRRMAAAHPNANLYQRLGSAETIKAVEFLARQDLAGSEADLAADGELAEALMRAAGGTKQAAPAAPASVAPGAPGTPSTPPWRRA
jgi:hypothetical protein